MPIALIFLSILYFFLAHSIGFLTTTCNVPGGPKIVLDHDIYIHYINVHFHHFIVL